jgi:hypothetical protein
MAGLCDPLSMLRRSPRGQLRMTRGRCGSLLLHRDGLAPSTPCRSPGALRFTPESGRVADIPDRQVRASSCHSRIATDGCPATTGRAGINARQYPYPYRPRLHFTFSSYSPLFHSRSTSQPSGVRNLNLRSGSSHPGPAAAGPGFPNQTDHLRVCPSGLERGLRPCPEPGCCLPCSRWR